MNWDPVAGKWHEIKGQARAQWAKLTDEDLDYIGGKYDQLVGRLRQRYGYEKEKAQEEVDKFVASVKTTP